MERKLLQAAVAIAGLAGVFLGLTGVLFGTLYADLSGDVVLDSYVRFGKGVLLAIGLIYWSCIPQIEQRGERIALVTLDPGIWHVFAAARGGRSRRTDTGPCPEPDCGTAPGAAAVVVAAPRRGSRATQRRDLMKRVAVWVAYAVGALAIGYLALYAYAMFSGRDLQPGDPIHIFRKPDAPSYSSTTIAPSSLRPNGSAQSAAR